MNWGIARPILCVVLCVSEWQGCFYVASVVPGQCGACSSNWGVWLRESCYLFLLPFPPPPLSACVCVCVCACVYVCVCVLVASTALVTSMYAPHLSFFGGECRNKARVRATDKARVRATGRAIQKEIKIESFGS